MNAGGDAHDVVGGLWRREARGSKTQLLCKRSPVSVSRSMSRDDVINFSQVTHLFTSLRELQNKNAKLFKQLLGEGASQLRAAAAQSSDTASEAIYKVIASKFNDAAESGDVTALQSARLANHLFRIGSRDL